MKKGHHYLVESKWGISKCKCLDVTEKCYQVKWEIGETVWIYKTDFESHFPTEAKMTIIECLE